jgi:hypothetical protein
VTGKAKFLIVLSSVALAVFLSFIVLPVFHDRHSFFRGAKIYNATIVQVEQEERRRRWGSSVAYIPVVEITDEQGMKVKLRVDDYSRSPVYRIGDKMSVLYNEAVSDQCIINSFSEKWGDILLNSIMFIGAFFSILPSIFFRRRRPDNYKRKPLTLNKREPLTVEKRPNYSKRRRKRR